jgi:hypothetical protein
VQAVTPGRLYYWRKALPVAQLVNGTEIITASGEFTAQTATVSFVHDPAFPAALTALGLLFAMSWTITPTWVQTAGRTRGYTGTDPGDQSPEACAIRNAVKIWQRATLALSTWFPEFSVLALTDGVEEETTIADGQTADRTQYYRPAFATPYDETNVNDDHAVPYREDYSVVLSDATTPSGNIVAGVQYFVESLDGAGSILYNAVVYTAPALFTGLAGVATYTVNSGAPSVYGPGSYVFMGDNGIDFGRLQRTPVPLHLANSGVRGRYLQLEFRSTAGVVRWAGCDIEGVLKGAPVFTTG